ncbi:hypothetical protein CEUSTIGMA_g8427.t1 [Chlamydomonas eustigma]|uniref:Hflx-type G domain-containing protein n=1 Tax=Chlamydomonas eustigma TaxID=1157962 RepID=A0A250XDN2_9CHLO|nr:hypothetical protein CEUSTIGMA_g8427.t1 [Chlamydomonas eustigma]|eukprot:GAX80992.1 hypothetical protein CEUSTIGMA_g8427.t1 [Chlamydomonas eustigma]
MLRLLLLHLTHSKPSFPTHNCSIIRALPLVGYGRGLSVKGGAATSPCFLVQPRNRKDIHETQKLVDAFSPGSLLQVLTVGHSSRLRPGPYYFGKGVVHAIRSAVLSAERESASRKWTSLDFQSGSQESSDSSSRVSQAEGDDGYQSAISHPIMMPDESLSHYLSSQPLMPPDPTATCRVLVNATLNPLQERNLSALLGRPVIDRVGLILGIFANRARTKEAKLQVELASLMHQKTRLVRGGMQHIRLKGGRHGNKVSEGVDGEDFRGGLGAEAADDGVRVEVVSARQRGRSGAGSLGGGGGSGDPEVQMQRYRILRRMKALRQDLKAAKAIRALHRQGRKNAGLPQVAVVGYTNVGKSTMVNTLTGSSLISKDALFVTLDPTARRLQLPQGDACVLSDTVGFISDLPVDLVEAFKSTLEEVVQADLIIHVLDASSANVIQQREAVVKILETLGVSPQRLQHQTVEVWNKCDRVQLLQTDADSGLDHRSTSSSCNVQLPQSSTKLNSSSETTFHYWREAWRRRHLRDSVAWRRRGSRTLVITTSLINSSSLVEQTSTESLTSSTSCSSPGAEVGSGGLASHETSRSDSGDLIQIEHSLSGTAHCPIIPDITPISTSSTNPSISELMPNSGAIINDTELPLPPMQSLDLEGSNSVECPISVTSVDHALAEEEGEEERRADEILNRVASLVRQAHSRSKYQPQAVAASAVLGWGHDRLLEMVERKLSEAGLLRGTPTWRRHSQTNSLK